MEQSELNAAIAEMERHLETARDSTSCNLSMSTMLALARAIRDERDARCALARLQEQRDQRLEGEIAERSQRQLEITGRLAELERRIVPRGGCSEPGTPPWMAEREAEREARESTREPTPCTAGPLAIWGALTPGHQPTREPTCNGQHPPPACGDPECWHVKEKGPGKAVQQAIAEAERVAIYRRRWETVRASLESQVTAQQQALDDVWALVEETDGYGSPFWSEPGLDDTTPAQAVAAVLEHLRAQIAEHEAEGVERRRDYTEELTEALGYGTGTIVWHRALDLVRETILQRNGAREQVAAQAKIIRYQAETIGRYQLGYPAEAMAALNAADRQSDDDQICGS